MPTFEEFDQQILADQLANDDLAKYLESSLLTAPKHFSLIKTPMNPFSSWITHERVHNYSVYKVLRYTQLEPAHANNIPLKDANGGTRYRWDRSVAVLTAHMWTFNTMAWVGWQWNDLNPNGVGALTDDSSGKENLVVANWLNFLRAVTGAVMILGLPYTASRRFARSIRVDEVKLQGDIDEIYGPDDERAGARHYREWVNLRQISQQGGLDARQAAQFDHARVGVEYFLGLERDQGARRIELARTKERIAGAINKRLKINSLVLFGFGLNSVVGVVASAMQMSALWDAPGTTGADRTRMGFGLASGVLGATTMFSKSLATISLATNADGEKYSPWLSARTKRWSRVTALAGLSQSVMNIGMLSATLATPKLTEGQKNAVIAELTLQIAGGLLDAAGNIWLASRLAKGTSIAGPASVVLLGALTMALSPIQIQGLIDQQSYADALRDMADETGSYSADVLARFYAEKSSMAIGFFGAEAGLALLSTIGMTALALSATGPTGMGIDVAVAVLAAMMPFIEDAALQGPIDDLRHSLANFPGGSQGFALNEAQRTLWSMGDGSVPRADSPLAQLQADGHYDSVVAIASLPIRPDTLEAAAVAGMSGDVPLVSTVGARYDDGLVQWTARQPDIAADWGGINVDDAPGAGKSQLVTFLSPLGVPTGKYGTHRERIGAERTAGLEPAIAKAKYITRIVWPVSTSASWQLDDGDASTTFDLRNTVSRMVWTVDDVAHQLPVSFRVHGGGGNDAVIASVGAIDFDGGSGFDTLDYSGITVQVGGSVALEAAPDADGFTITKVLQKADTFTEAKAGKNTVFQIGQRVEEIETLEIKADVLKGDQPVTVRDIGRDVEGIVGSIGNDEITGDAEGNILRGMGGNDSIHGAGGDDILAGGSGVNYIDGGEGLDTLDLLSEDIVPVAPNQPGSGVYLEMGFSSLRPFYLAYSMRDGGVGGSTIINVERVRLTDDDDEAHGNEIANAFWGMGGDDQLHGREGNDLLSGGLGQNTLDGGDGNDMADYSSANDDTVVSNGSVFVNLVTGSALFYQDFLLPTRSARPDLISDQLTSVESVRATSGDDYIIGNAEQNVLYGGSGADVLLGAAGDDVLNPGGMQPNRLTDFMDGGEGNDTADFSEVGSTGVVVDLSDVRPLSNIELDVPLMWWVEPGSAYDDALYQRPLLDTVSGAWDLMLSIENVIGTAGSDRLTGTLAANALSAHGGDDVLHGLAGDDSLDGGGGADELDGGEGDDSFRQGVWLSAQADVLRFAAADTLSGGDGFDSVEYTLLLAADPAPDQQGIFADLGSGTIHKAFVGNSWQGRDTVIDVEGVVGTDASDTLLGNSGANELWGMGGRDWVSGGDGEDTLIGGLGDDTVSGDKGDDLLMGQQGADRLLGGDGDDTLVGGTESDVLDGGAGNDLASFNEWLLPSGDGVYASLVTGKAHVRLAVNGSLDETQVDLLVGVEGLMGTAKQDHLEGDAGDNTLVGGEGVDTLVGGDGNDLLIGGGGDDSLDGGLGNDVIVQSRQDVDETVTGGEGADAVDYSQSDADDLYGIVADLSRQHVVKRIHVLPASDTLVGIESVIATGHNDTLIGSSGENGFDGGGGDDAIDAGAGTDHIFGGAGFDTIVGGDGDDVVYQDLEKVDDQIDGGAGNDTLDYSGITERSDGLGQQGIIVDLAAGKVGKFGTLITDLQRFQLNGLPRTDVVIGGVDQVKGIQNVTGTGLDDQVVGDDGDNALDGLEGSDIIHAGAGNDDLFGGLGVDRVHGESGDDHITVEIERNVETIDGGSGQDGADYGNSSGNQDPDDFGNAQAQGIRADLASGSVQKYFGADTYVDLLVGIEDLSGSDLHDQIYGTEGNNSLAGQVGNDLLDGRGGDDVLNGGMGSDTLLDGAGDDQLVGSSGNDLVDGGDGDDTLLQQMVRGNDTLQGGAGIDTVDYSISDDRISGHGVNAELGTGRVYKSINDIDTLVGIENLVGTAGNDSLQGSDGDNLLQGGEGLDHLIGFLGKDGLDGGGGDDWLDGGEGDDVLAGGRGSDMLFGFGGDDTYHFQGGDGVDWIFEGAGNDKLVLQSDPTGAAMLSTNLWMARYGWDLCITVIGGAGDVVRIPYFFVSTNWPVDTLFAADGKLLHAADVAALVDVMSRYAPPAVADPALLPAAVLAEMNARWKLQDTGAQLTGGAGADLLTAGAGDDTVMGGAGGDKLVGNGGNDLFLQAIDDAGADLIDGGAGIDTLSYDLPPFDVLPFDSDKGVVVDLTAGTAQRWAGRAAVRATDLLSGIENVMGSELDDTLAGGAGDNQLAGGDGHDLLQGGAGDDQLSGDAGVDRLEGGLGSDTYVFARDDGADLIVETDDAAAGSLDALRFTAGPSGDGVSAGDVSFERAANGDLVVRVVSSGDLVWVQGFFSSEAQRIEYVVDSEGRSLSAADILGLLAGSTAGPVTPAAALWQANRAPVGTVNLGGASGPAPLHDDVLKMDPALFDVDGIAGDVAFRWQSLGTGGIWTDIGGATGDTLALNNTFIGQRLRAVASFTDGLGHAEAVASAATAAVVWRQGAPTGSVLVNGDAVEKQTLVVGQDLDDPDGMGPLNLQWERSVDGGATWLALAGATAASLTLTQALVGSQLRVKAFYTDGTGRVETVYSVPTPVVLNANDAPTGSVSLSGAFTEQSWLSASDNVADGDGMGTDKVYHWQRSYDNGATFSEVATGPSYYAGSGIGLLRAVLTYTDLFGKAESVSSASVPIADINDTPTGTLGINGIAADGTVKQGQVLTVNDQLSDADGNGTGRRYLWFVRNTQGATFVGEGVSLLLTQSMVGWNINLDVRYVDGHGYDNLFFSSAKPLVVDVDDPATGTFTLAGTASQGSTLTFVDNVADIDGINSRTYRWQASQDGQTWVDMVDATGNSFTLGQAQVGWTLRATMSYVDNFGRSNTVATFPTAAVANVGDAPTGSVLVSGVLKRGQLLTVTDTLADIDGLGVRSYEWQGSANGSTWQTFGTGTSVLLDQAQVGQHVRVLATYVDGQGTLTSVASTDAGVVAALPSVTLTGTPSQNQVLTATSNLSGPGGTAPTISWQCSFNNGATWTSFASGSTATLGQPQVGAMVRAVVSGTDNAGNAATVASAPTAAIANVNDAPTGTFALSGVLQQGQTLTIVDTVLDPDGEGAHNYAWQTSADGGVTWGTLGWDRNQTLVLGQAQVGALVRALVNYTDGGGTSIQFGTAVSAPVANVDDPLRGSVRLDVSGSTVTAVPVLQDDDGAGYVSYQWFAKSGSATYPTAIPGATSASITLPSLQNPSGMRYMVSVTMVDAAGNVGKISSPYIGVPAPGNVSPGGLLTMSSSTAAEGQTLTVSDGVTDADVAGSRSYTWQTSDYGTNWIDLATGSSLVVPQAAVGLYLRVVLNYIDARGTYETVASARTTARVANVNNAPVGTVSITGTVAQGAQVKTTVNLSDVDGMSTNGVPIRWETAATATGARTVVGTLATYVPGAADVGRYLFAVANYVDSLGTTENVSSAGVLVANVNDRPTGGVTVTGTMAKGQTLTASAASLADADGLGTLAYQWQSSADQITWTAIAGATGTSYTLTQAEVGRHVRMLVSYTDAGGAAESMASSVGTAVAYAEANQAPAGSLTISGTAQQGQLLKAASTLTDNDGMGVIAWRWESTAIPSFGYVPIAGATQDSFLLPDAVVGAYVRVVATWTDQHGNVETVASSPTSPVTNLNDRPTGTLSIVGNLVQGQTLSVAGPISDADGYGGTLPTSYKWEMLTDELAQTWQMFSAGSVATLQRAQVGRSIRVWGTYYDMRGGLNVITSAVTGHVQLFNTPISGSVSVSGIARQGETLTINSDGNIVDAQGLTSDVRYVWETSTDGVLWTPLVNTDQRTLTLEQAQVGGYVRGVMFVMDGNGTLERLQSAATPIANVNDRPTGALNLSYTTPRYPVDGGGWTWGGPFPASYATRIEEDGSLSVTALLSDADGMGTLSYTWQASANGRDGWTPIVGATGPTLTLSAKEVGSYVRAVGTYTDGGNTVEIMASELPPAQVVHRPHAGTVSLGGSARVGQALMATVSDPDGPNAASIVYQWQSAAAGTPANGTWTDIAGATGASYLPVAAQAGQILRVKATYTDLFGDSESATSDATAAVARANLAPIGWVKLGGVRKVGQTLTATPLLSDANGMGALSYQWQVSDDGLAWTDLAGATASTYLQGVQHLGKRLRVVASYTDGDGTLEVQASGAAGPVESASDPTPVTGSLSFTGTARQGEVLTGTATLADADGIVGPLHYQWQYSPDGQATWYAIAGATSSTYTLTQAEVGLNVRMIAWYTDGAGRVGLAATTPSSLVKDDVATGAVSWSGVAQQGQALTASASGLGDIDGIVSPVTYQWQVSSDSQATWTDIAGAAGATFTPTQAQTGKNLRVQAVFTDGAGVVNRVSSAASTLVKDDVATGTVVIDGLAVQGQALTASASGLADIDGIVSPVTYQWQVSLDGQATWTDIAGATGASFTPSQSQVGKNLRAQAVFTDGAGVINRVASASTIRVIDDMPGGALVIQGEARQDQQLMALDTLTDLEGIAGAAQYQWQMSDGQGGWADIAGATDISFLLTQNEVGHNLRVQATFTDTTGTVNTVASLPTSSVANVNAQPLGELTLDGGLQQGQTLSVNSIDLVDEDGIGTLNYVWQSQALGEDTWATIDGETGSSLLLQQAEVGRRVRAIVYYTDDGGSVEVLATNPTLDVIADVNDAPQGTVGFSGVLAEGQVLSATQGLSDADGMGPVSFSWQFSVDGGSTWHTATGTGSTHTLVAADIGALVRVSASYADNFGRLEQVTGAASSMVVANVNDAPQGSVSFSGLTRQGSTLTASYSLQDADNGVGPVSLRWESSADGRTGWTAVAGASAATLQPTQNEVGRYLRVVASYTDGFGTIEQVASAASADKVANVNDAPVGALSIEGAAFSEHTVVASPALSDADGLGALAYRWEASADGGVSWSAIAGAAAASYVLTQADIGRQMRVVTSYVDGQGTSEQVASAPTGVVKFNQQPILYYPNEQWAVADRTLAFVLPESLVYDPGDTPALSARLPDGSALPGWLRFDSSQRMFYGTPATSDVGSIDVVVTATDGGGLSNNSEFTLVVRAATQVGTEGGDSLLAATSANATMLGEGGDDSLMSGDGNDLLVGGEGSDTLYSKDGADVYYVGRDQGADLIDDLDVTPAMRDIDRVVFDPSVSADQLWFSKVGSDLQVSVIGTDDKVVITGWDSTEHQIEVFRAGDGRDLWYGSVDAMVNAMAGMAPPAVGETTLTQAQRDQLAPVLSAWH